MKRGSRNRGIQRNSNPAFRWLLAAGLGAGAVGVGAARAELAPDSITVSSVAVGQPKGLSSRGLVRHVGDGTFRRTMFTTGVERDAELIQTPEPLDLRPVPKSASRISFGTVGQLSSGSSSPARAGVAEEKFAELSSGENPGVLSWMPDSIQQAAIVSQQIQALTAAKQSQEVQLIPSFSDLRMALAAAAAVSGVGNPLQVIVGDHNLQAELAGQSVTLQVKNTSASPIQVAGLNLYLQVADGGPGFGSILGPRIEAGDLATGTLFASNNNGTTIIDVLPQLGAWSLITLPSPSGGVTTVSLGAGETKNIGTFMFDTTGVPVGSYDLQLEWTAAGVDPAPTRFVESSGNELDLELRSGHLVVVPEPWAVSLVSSLALGGFVWVRRSRQSAVRA